MKKILSKSLMLILAGAILMPCSSSKAESVVVKNISGANRYSTAISISKNGWIDKSDNVILVNSYSVADSLSVAPLASKLKAPVLLTKSSDLDNATLDEIKRLQAKNIIIIGGEGSVSSNIENFLKENSFTVQRIGGRSRIETSVKIADELKKLNGDKFKEGFIVNGFLGLADAAGIGSIAAKNNIPIIYVNNVPVKASGVVFDYQKMYLIGGTANISKEFESMGIPTERIAGANRNETNSKIIERFYDKYDTVYIADDGRDDPSKLIDSVLVNAAIISSNNKNTTQVSDSSADNKNTTQAPDSSDSNTNSNPVTNSTTDASNGTINTTDTTDTLNSSETNTNANTVNSTQGEPIATKDVVLLPADASSEAVNTSQSMLPEGPVMLVSSKDGFTYSQLRIMNNDVNKINKIMQVTGGTAYAKHIDFIAGFIRHKGEAKADNAFNKILSYENVVIEYKTKNNGVKKLNGNSILRMIISGEKNDFNVEFDQSMLKNFIANIDPEGYSEGSNDSYAYWKNGDVVIAKQKANMALDKNSVITNLNNMLNQAKSFFAVEPKYVKSSSTNIPRGATNIGKKYIEVDIGTQDMRMWNYGKQILYTPVVTGNPNRGMSTPIGIYKIQYMQKNRVLRGPGYASHVDYWISFNGPYGIHDSYWQSAYGGSRYLYAGSHGCVNTPLKNMAFLYNNSSLGTPVIIHK